MFARSWRLLLAIRRVTAPSFLLLHYQNGAAGFPRLLQQRCADHLARKRPSTPIDGLDDQFGRIAVAGQAVADRLPQLPNWQADIEVQEVLALDLLRPQAPQVLGLVAPDEYQQILVHNHYAAAETG